MISDDIAFGGEKHKLVLEALLARVKLWENDRVNLTDRLDRCDKDFGFYMSESSLDASRRIKRDSGKPQFTTLYIPYSYAMLMSAHTYISTVFLSRTPVQQYAGRHGESEMNVQAVEAIMEYQTTVGEHMAPLYVWLLDALKYGVGVIGDYWCVERNVVSEITDEPVTFGGIPLEGRSQKVRTVREVEGYTGNKLFNVRPHDYIYDPRVPLSATQSGEFCGRAFDIGWNTIVKRKIANYYVNVDEVEKRIKAPGAASERYATIVPGTDLPNQNVSGSSHTKTSLVAQLPAIELVCEIIPKEWMLGTTEDPEKWQFTILDRKIIVEARPLGSLFNKFPFRVLDGEIEGYSLVKRSMLEIARPLNDVMSWLVNTHFFAVRKSLNGDVIYDPSRIVESDLLKSDGTGTRVRMRPQAYGEDARTMIYQLTGSADVTGRHLQDTQLVGELLQRVTGVNDNVMGVLDPGGRKTATEVRTSSSASINRVKILAEYYSAQGWAQLAQHLLSQTQQLYSGDKKFRIAGDQIANPQTFLQITPDAIAGQYDYIPVDGTLPIDRFAMTNMWTNLLGQLRQFPQIAMQYDMGKIFEWVAQLGGLKNIKQFRVQVVPDGMTPPGAIPMGGQNGGTGAPVERPLAAGGGTSPVIPLPRQVPGVGRAG